MPIKPKGRGQRLIIFLIFAIIIMILIDRIYPQWFFGYQPDRNSEQGESIQSSKIPQKDRLANHTTRTASVPFLNIELLNDMEFQPELSEDKFISFEQWIKTVGPADNGRPENPLESLRDNKHDDKRLHQKAMSFKIPAPWRKYAAKAKPAQGKPKIVIIIDDLGQRREMTQRFIDLSAPLTLAFLPYASNLQNDINRSREKGHEVMLHVPMEPMSSGIDPGPDTLRDSMRSGELLETLRSNLDKVTGYVGINNHMGSRLTQNTNAMQTIMSELNERGLLFIDSHTINNSKAYETALRYSVPTHKRDIFLDHFPDKIKIRQAFAQLERTAREKGLAIAIGHPYPQTYEILKEFLSHAHKAGLQIVPVSSVVKTSETKIAISSGSKQAPENNIKENNTNKLIIPASATIKQ